MKTYFAALLLVLLTACVHSPQEEEAPRYGVIVTGHPSFFEHANTFSWHPALAKAFVREESLGDKAVGWYQRAIEEELYKKGYRLSGNGESDFVVGFGIAQQSSLSDESIYSKTRLSTGVEQFHSDESNAEKGSVYIVFFSSSSPQPAWKILTQGSIERKKSDQEREKMAQGLVSMMLRKVPESL